MQDEGAYGYDLPESLVAKAPASPRDSSRLFVYDTKTDTVTFATFRQIDRFVPSPSLLVLNDTSVVPARLVLAKPTGGKIEVFLLLSEPRTKDGAIRGMVDRRAVPGWRLSFPNGEYLTIVGQEEQFFRFVPSVGARELWNLIDRYGLTPIPKYIKGVPLGESALRKKYQSMFAKTPASVAAPTASLHFTPRVMRALAKRRVKSARVTLHVGPGTFAPVTEEHLRSGRLHTEYGRIDAGAARSIMDAKRRGVPVIAVGTTATRIVEACAKERDGSVIAGEREVDLFIRPPYDFRVADALVTNFHIPGSSLMMLVEALLRSKGAKRSLVDLYRIAIRERFRFYSFGDAMLIL